MYKSDQLIFGHSGQFPLTQTMWAPRHTVHVYTCIGEGDTVDAHVSPIEISVVLCVSCSPMKWQKATFGAFFHLHG